MTTRNETVYAAFRHFDAIDRPREGRKTRILSLVSKSSGQCLGHVQWYSAWRRYCFFPAGSTVWSDDCLRDVQTLLDLLAAERKAKP